MLFAPETRCCRGTTMIETVNRMAVGFAIASVLAFGGNVFGAAIAVAEPLVWDIEAYDDCMSKTVRDANQCCVDSGGIPTDEPLGDGKGQKCQAPPAEAQGSGQLTVTPGKLPPGVVALIGPTEIAGDPGAPPRSLPDISAPTLTLVPTA